MRWSFATIGMFILGIVGVAAIVLFQNLTTSNENDYYLLKEITEAAMYDSIDLTYYRDTGEVRIIKEKFVENFTRRYAESTLFIGTNYILSFYNIMEEPPKVSILVNTGIMQYQIYDDATKADYNVNNALTGIFEYVGKKTSESVAYYNPEFGYEEMSKQLYVTNTLDKTYYSNVSVDSNGNVGTTQSINIPEELQSLKIKDETLKIKSVSAEPITDLNEILIAKLRREIDWKSASTVPTKYYNVVNLDRIAGTLDSGINFYYYNCDYDIDGVEGEAVVSNNSYMICSDYDGFWIHWDGKTSETGVNQMFLKLNITWEYEEYEYDY